MIIDPSNAPCGPGSIPGLRLSEGRPQSIEEVPPRGSSPRGWGVAALVRFVPRNADVEVSPPLPALAPWNRLCAGRPTRLAAARGLTSLAARRSHRAPRRTPAGSAFGRGKRPSPRDASPLVGRSPTISQRPQIRRDDPLNLSILLSGGKETNKDSPSSGERRGKSPAPNPRPRRAREMWRTGDGRRPGVDRGPESF